MSDRWLVIGLGNPGEQYALTRHNIGQMVIHHLASGISGATFSPHKSRMEIADIRFQSIPVVLAQSRGYMNESGIPSRLLADFYRIEPAHVVVIHDELDIAFNTIRVRFGGGDNGHNGLKSVTSHFGTANYFRVRMGIGRPPIPQQSSADFVLKQFSAAEKKELPEFISRGASAIEHLITKGLELTQQEFNQ